MTNDTKTPIFSVADESCQYCFSVSSMKSYSKKNLTVEEILFNYRLFRGRRVTDSVIAIWITRFKSFENLANMIPDKVSVVLMATTALHSFWDLNQRIAIPKKVWLMKFKSIDHSYKENNVKIFVKQHKWFGESNHRKGEFMSHCRGGSRTPVTSKGSPF